MAAETMTAPDARHYRMDPDDINPHRCMARKIRKGDKRWTIEVMYESQCGKEHDEGIDERLCTKCKAKLDRYAASPSAKIGWCGTLDEEPLPWQHMLGTAWAAAAISAGRLKWLGAPAKSE